MSVAPYHVTEDTTTVNIKPHKRTSASRPHVRLLRLLVDFAVDSSTRGVRRSHDNCTHDSRKNGILHYRNVDHRAWLILKIGFNLWAPKKVKGDENEVFLKFPITPLTTLPYSIVKSFVHFKIYNKTTVLLLDLSYSDFLQAACIFKRSCRFCSYIPHPKRPISHPQPLVTLFLFLPPLSLLLFLRSFVIVYFSPCHCPCLNFCLHFLLCLAHFICCTVANY